MSEYPSKTFEIEKNDYHYYQSALFHKLGYAYLQNYNVKLFHKITESINIEDRFQKFWDYVNLERGFMVRVGEKEVKVSSHLEEKINEEISTLKEIVEKMKHPKEKRN